MLGIHAEFVDTGWKVRSLMVNSIASRAKVRLGDIVEAIDGQQLKGDSTPRGSVTVLTVLRDGKSIDLNLK
jgi:C-terminal processing protease CtpA/Prc